MAENRCTQEKAIKILKTASSSRNIKLREVAASVLAAITESADVTTHFDN